MKSLASVAVPDYSGFSLVGDTDCLNALDGVAILFELLGRIVDAGGDGRDEFVRVVFMPARVWIDLGEFLK